MTALWTWLEGEGAHSDVVEWARPYGADWERAWSECPRGDWLLGLAARREVAREALVRAARACAELAMDYVPDDEGRPHEALAAIDRWIAGDGASREETCRAAERAIDEAPDPAVAAAATAAFAALRAIDAPEEAPAAAAAAVQAAVLDAGDCAMMSALGYAQRTCADRVREHVPFAVIAPRG